MKSFNSPSKAPSTSRANATVQRVGQAPVKPFVDNRPTTVAQRKLQEQINNSIKHTVQRRQDNSVKFTNSVVLTGNVIQRALKIDGKDIKKIEDVDLQRLPENFRGEDVKDGINFLISCGNNDFTHEEFIRNLSTLLGLSVVKENDFSLEKILNEYGIKFNDAKVFSSENREKLLNFLKENPGLLKKIKEHKDSGKIKLNLISLGWQPAGMFGGGVYHYDDENGQGVLGLERGEGHGEFFMEMLMHELGHATFQRFLLHEAGANESYKSVSKEGEALLKAFEILKQSKSNFLGVKLGDDSPRQPEGRQGYQQGKVNEFCAESFMHMVLHRDELLEHVQALITDNKVDEKVKKAWLTVLDVLNKITRDELGLNFSDKGNYTSDQENSDVKGLLHENNCLINAICSAAGRGNATEQELVDIRNFLVGMGFPFGAMLVAGPQTLDVIRQVLGLGNRGIYVTYNGLNQVDSVSGINTIYVEHNGFNHFVAGQPIVFVPGQRSTNRSSNSSPRAVIARNRQVQTTRSRANGHGEKTIPKREDELK